MTRLSLPVTHSPTWPTVGEDGKDELRAGRLTEWCLACKSVLFSDKLAKVCLVFSETGHMHIRGVIVMTCSVVAQDQVKQYQVQVTGWCDLLTW
jgi:hypothetical protein